MVTHALQCSRAGVCAWRTSTLYAIPRRTARITGCSRFAGRLIGTHFLNDVFRRRAPAARTRVTRIETARLAERALASRLPTMSGEVGYAKAGGLMNYEPNLPESWCRAATYVDKILKGAKPTDLPVEQPTKHELVLNLKTAQALELTFPPHLLVLADEVRR